MHGVWRLWTEGVVTGVLEGCRGYSGTLVETVREEESQVYEKLW